jgi:hypothetical protein
MRTLTIKLPAETITVRPVPRANLSLFSDRMVELQALWIAEEFSTGDAIAIEQAWQLMQSLWCMLPLAETPSVTLNAESLESLSSDYEQLGQLFFGDPSGAWHGSIETFDLKAFAGCKLWELHEVNPRKKLIAADQLRRAKPPTAPLPQLTSPSKPAGTQKQTRSRTSSTGSAKSA